MKPIFCKSRAFLQYTYSGIQYSYILFLPVFIFLYTLTTFPKPLVRVNVPESVNSAILLNYDERMMDNYPCIYVGEPLDLNRCFPIPKYKIYVRDGFISNDEIPLYLSAFQTIHAPINKRVYLIIDRYATMDVVYSIREKLRETGFYRVCYVVN